MSDHGSSPNRLGGTKVVKDGANKVVVVVVVVAVVVVVPMVVPVTTCADEMRFVRVSTSNILTVWMAGQRWRGS